MPQPTYLSREGLEKLQAELEYLRTVRRHDVAESIQQSRERGGTVSNAGGLGRAETYSIAMISSLILPEGALTSITSLTRLPSRLLPMGDTLEILPWAGSASALPVMVYW